MQSDERALRDTVGRAGSCISKERTATPSARLSARVGPRPPDDPLSSTLKSGGIDRLSKDEVLFRWSCRVCHLGAANRDLRFAFAVDGHAMECPENLFAFIRRRRIPRVYPAELDLNSACLRAYAPLW